MPIVLLQAEAKAAALAAAKAAFQKQERENAQIAEKARKQRQGRAAPAQPAAAAAKPGAGSEVRHCGHHGSNLNVMQSSLWLSLSLGRARTAHTPGATLPHSLCTLSQHSRLCHPALQRSLPVLSCCTAQAQGANIHGANIHGAYPRHRHCGLVSPLLVLPHSCWCCAVPSAQAHPTFMALQT